jgi:hypothetical protein
LFSTIKIGFIYRNLFFITVYIDLEKPSFFLEGFFIDTIKTLSHLSHINF